ncbi:GNAT family N-acetyltransferase [Nonomuraea angiospora]|uniref:N-acetyltransferase domain-containing protein n=1 Tax=Nonomuraea angiospora TaxID=46172 RepID=A0ABR9M189_9ACTN|nr:GNAT family N-acetyltransferase [Nonomuraea angiospora]MBE1586664.1 hypothetical protein [Nonomuraea angiospora]
MTPVTTSSQRLTLREFTPADVDALLAIYGDPKVAEHMSFEPRTRDQVEKTIAGVIAAADADLRMGYNLAAVLPAGVGQCGDLCADSGEVRDQFLHGEAVGQRPAGDGVLEEVSSW